MPCGMNARNSNYVFLLFIPQPELYDGLPSIPTHLFMACSAEGDQVWFGVIAALAAKWLVVDFQFRHRAAELASPSVTPQHALPQLVALFRGVLAVYKNLANVEALESNEAT